jgi:septum formation protein
MKTALNQPPKIILASGSKYRQELLSRLQLPFSVQVPNIDETRHDSELPEATAMRLALEKAEAIAKLNAESIIIGSDQVATLNGEHIGKPGNHQSALLQLQKMQGKTVIFHTALCVLDTRTGTAKPKIQLENCQTLVTFRNLPDQELEQYLLAETPYDCAGSAKNEGLGIILLEKVQNDDPTALTGLPLITLTSMLHNLEVSFFKFQKKFT